MGMPFRRNHDGSKGGLEDETAHLHRNRPEILYASVECRERGLDPLDTNLALQMKAGRIRPSALPSRRPSRATVSPGADGCSRSSSA